MQFIHSFLLSIACLFVCVIVSAQEPVKQKDQHSSALYSQRFCSNEVWLHQKRLDKKFTAKEDKMNRQIMNYNRSLADTLTIPVVVHIINNDPYSIPDIQVINGIIDLNHAFGKTGPYAASKGVDTKIRFCLAKKDPDGGVTNGITRTTSYYGKDLNMETEDARLKNLIQWDPTRYMNIWLVENIYGEVAAYYACGSWSRTGVDGYATMPPDNTNLDGIVVTRFGVLLAHETGHYLGLYHTFEGGCRNVDCTLDGDKVCDTPPDGASTTSAGGCSNPDNSCNTDTLSNYSNGIFFTNVPDPIANFMDYGNDACSNEFTQGQADRMHAAILISRPGLLQDECTPPCGETYNISFTRDTAYTSVGETVNFTNTSSGATNFSWLVNDVASGTGNTFSYSFPAVGKYKITLKGWNANINCFGTYTSYVIVNCGVAARFYFDRKTIASLVPEYPDSILFTNTSFGATSFQWLIGTGDATNEQVVSTSKDLTYTFPLPDDYLIRLVSTNGSCRDTSSYFVAHITDPRADGTVFLYNAYCYQQNKIRLSLCIDNFGYASIPKNTPVTFYDADPRQPGAHRLYPDFLLPYETSGGNCRYCFNHELNIGYAGLDKVFAVFNDSGNTAPLALPNRTFPEKNYTNNVGSVSGLAFSVTATPATATLLPGDTLQLLATATQPSISKTFLWSDAYKLSCTTCVNPLLYADSDRVKMVIATTQYGCKDTAFINIKVPPADDYTIALDSVICASKNTMTVNFTLFNQFFRGVIPKNLKVSFYNGDPATTTAVLLKPVFSVPDTVFALKASFTTTIDIIPEGRLYAVVNDSSLIIPVVLPNTPKLEKIYTNNTASIPYAPIKTSVDTSICAGQNYFGHGTTGTFTDTLSAYNGCDSIRTVNLIVKPIFTTSYTVSICQGEDYFGHTSTGTFTDVYTAVNGCDSTRTVVLTVNPVFNTRVDTTLCQDESYAGYTTTGVYIDSLKTIYGCDSVRTLYLTVNPKKFITINPEICEGESFFAGGRLQTTSGIYYDTLQTYLGCDSIKTTNLIVRANPRPNLGADRGICNDGTYTMDPGTFTTYLWQDGTTNPTFTTATLGRYFVKVTNEFGCVGSDTINLTSYLPLPKNFLPADTSLCLGNIVRVAVPGYKTYVWSNGSTSSAINITQSGTYRLTVTDQYDCVGIDSMKVLFFTNCIIVGIPNAFTPNSDGRNETFKPYMPAPVNNYTMRIYNRFGEMVFETHTPSAGWDGTYKGNPQDPATFVYYITFTNYRGELESRRGTVVLIR